MLQWNRRADLGSPATDVRAKLPACYSQEFDDCLIEYRRAVKAGEQPRPSAYCDQYYPIVANTPGEIWDEAMDLMPYCPGGAAAKPKKDTSGVWPALAVISVMGGLLAIVVNVSGARF